MNRWKDHHSRFTAMMNDMTRCQFLSRAFVIMNRSVFFDRCKDEHKDWKPLKLEIMRRFTLVGSAMEFGNLPRGN